MRCPFSCTRTRFPKASPPHASWSRGLAGSGCALLGALMAAGLVLSGVQAVAAPSQKPRQDQVVAAEPVTGWWAADGVSLVDEAFHAVRIMSDVEPPRFQRAILLKENGKTVPWLNMIRYLTRIEYSERALLVTYRESPYFRVWEREGGTLRLFEAEEGKPEYFHRLKENDEALVEREARFTFREGFRKDILSVGGKPVARFDPDKGVFTARDPSLEAIVGPEPILVGEYAEKALGDQWRSVSISWELPESGGMTIEIQPGSRLECVIRPENQPEQTLLTIDLTSRPDDE